MSQLERPVWLAAGLRTPFARVDGPLADLDAIALSVPVLQASAAQLTGARPDFVVWGAVVPNLTWSNLAREVCLEADLDPTIPAYTTVLACSTSMAGALQAASMVDGRGRDLALVGGVESMSHVQVGLSTGLSDRLRQLLGARSLRARLDALGALRLGDLRLYVPSVTNRTTGKSMGEHCEEMARTWSIARAEQDALALESHRRAAQAWSEGFFKELVIPVAGVERDQTVRPDTSFDKLSRLPPAFDRGSGQGTLTAGNSSPLTDGAAALWVATEAGLARLPASLPRVRLVDWEIGAVDLRREGLLMWPAYGIPRLLARHGLSYRDVDLWEIHEAFAAQVLCHLAALESREFVQGKVGISGDFGPFPRERINPHGGSIALGHPFGATGARILSQAVQELSARGAGSRAVVSICADGGQGSLALLQAG
jgi:acetyl-CoA C-acetyltransferase